MKIVGEVIKAPIVLGMAFGTQNTGYDWCLRGTGHFPESPHEGLALFCTASAPGQG